MTEQLSSFFSIEMIYMWLNLGVLPFWFILLFFPNSKVCNIFITSIFPIFILGGVYIYLFYYFIINEYNFFNNFNLYLSLSNLNELFNDNAFLIIFWTHFLSINLFCGAWIVSDGKRFGISKIIIFLPLIITYFVGPIGIFVYWLTRIFYAKRITLLD